MFSFSFIYSLILVDVIILSNECQVVCPFVLGLSYDSQLSVQSGSS